MSSADARYVWDILRSTAQWLVDNPLKLSIAMAGSAIAHMFFDLPGYDIRPKLKLLFPRKSNTKIEQLQFLIIAMVGGIVAMCLLRPPNEAASLLGGFSWYTTLQQLSRKVSD